MSTVVRKQVDRPRALIALLIGALMVFALAAAPARATIEVESFEFESLNADGSPSVQAGGHPAEVITRFKFASHGNGELNHRTGGEKIVPDQGARNMTVELPTGMIGNPTALPTCGEKELEAGGGCSPSSQVGVIGLNAPGVELPELQFPIFNMKTPPGVSAEFGFFAITVPVHLTAEVRTGSDYGISITVDDLPQTLPWTESRIVFWGVPASPSHDEMRGTCLSFLGPSGEICPSQAPEKPLLSNPSTCSSALTAVAHVDSWEETGSYATRVASNPAPGGGSSGIEGCQGLRFRPTLEVEPESTVAAGPVGLAVRLGVKQNDNPDGAAEATLDRAVVTLPQGVALSPSAADGLGACTPGQIRLNDSTEPDCPSSSQIGTVKIDTPLLADPLEGFLYLAEEGANPFGSKFAMYLVASGSGTLLKVAGKVEADPATGRLTTTFDENPQLPFETLELRFHGGPRAALSAPARCGSYETTAELTAWGAAEPQRLSSTFQIDQGCEAAGKFTPTLQAGTGNPVAGVFAPFTLRVAAPEGQQNLASIEAVLPEGLLAKLAGVPECPNSGAAAGDCPEASEVGTTTVGAGPGSSPIYVPQAGKEPTAVYLGGPYSGAPYSLIVKVPAQAGPFNLGTVVVRNGLFIDPETTQVTTKSDPLPQILDGVPITYRDVRVEIDRPGFTVNPTNCEPKQVGATLTSAVGTVATPSARFQAANCDSLGLEPKLALKFSGAPTRRGGHPKLTATLTTKKGDANLKQVQVTLPKTEFLENAHIKTVCTRVQYAANQCPARSVYGFAKAWTPLLDKPLEGPVYLRSSNHKLPDLVASLDGQIHVDLDGRISSVKSRIRNTFETVPDAPVTKFVLTMQGGGKGLLVNNTNICKAKPRANVEFDGQNGKVADTEPLVSVGGCGKGRKPTKGKGR